MKGLAAGKPVGSPLRPAPEHPVESCERPKGVHTPPTGLKSARPAERLCQTDTRSPLSTLNTIGFGEKASGETEAMVAGKGVCLVLGGPVS